GVALAILMVDLLHPQNRVDGPLGAFQGDRGTRLYLLQGGSIPCEDNRNGPDQAIGQARILDDGIEVLLRKEARERAHRARSDHLDIAELEIMELEGWKVFGLSKSFFTGLPRELSIDKLAPMGRYGIR